MSFPITLYINRKVNRLINEAHEELRTQPKSLELHDYIVLSWLGRLAKLSQEREEADKEQARKEGRVNSTEIMSL